MQNRRTYLILVGLILAALAGVAALAIPGSPAHKKVTLGLDLQGGLEVVLKAQPTKGQKLDSSALDRSVSIMRQRVNKLGVSEPEIRKQGSNQIVIQLAGVHDPAAAAKLIGKTAQLMLFDFENDLAGPSADVNGNPVATPSLYELLTQVQKQAAKGAPESYYLFRVKTVKVKTTKKVKVTDKTGHKTTVLKPVTKTKVEHSLVQNAANPASTLKELLKPFGGKTPPHSRILK